MSITVGFVSLGCAKNRVDCEMMMSKVHNGGFKLIEDAAMADVAAAVLLSPQSRKASRKFSSFLNLKKKEKSRRLLLQAVLHSVIQHR